MGEVKTPRQMFLSSIALIYMCAFTSIYVQIPGLYGDEGILPVRLRMPKEQRPLLEQLQASPSLLWLGPSLGVTPQQALELICLLGVALSLGAVLLGPLRDSLVYLCLWALYLSLYNVGGDFLHSEWDVLLLEAGFLAVLVAPLRLMRGHGYHDSVTFWLTRWLFFRVTFCTGVSKLATGDPAWYDLSALSHHLQNQMSPTPLAWYVHQLPDWLLKLGAVVLLHSGILVPLLACFAPIRHLRLFGFYVQLFVQLCHILTGNCGLLNLLSIALSFSLLDDDHFNSSPKKKKEKKSRTWKQTFVSLVVLLVKLVIYAFILISVVIPFKLQIDWEHKTLSSKTAFSHQEFNAFVSHLQGITIWIGVLSFTWEAVGAMLKCVCTRGIVSKLWSLIQWAVMTAAAVALFTLSVVPYSSMPGMSVSIVFPQVHDAYTAVEKFHLVGAYGIPHRTLSTEGRPEIVLEGSHDGLTWTEISPTYKPGNVNAVPPIVGLHQPRLEWMMWQAAQEGREKSPWFTGLVQRLLQGKPEVVSLLQVDEAQYPFSPKPPALIKAKLYNYHFTDPAKDKTHLKSWWRRQYKGEFFPIVNLDDPTLNKLLDESGLKEKFPAQPGSDTPVSEALSLIRGPVKGLSGSLVISTLLATVTAIFLIKSVFSWFSGSQKPRPASSDHKNKKSKEPSETAEKSHTTSASNRSGKKDSNERKGDSDRSPRKRK